MSNLGDGISLVAYPWLASALTRNPILISGVLVAQRVPWLLVSLPVGVAVDRRDRRSLMIGADIGRALLTTIVAIAVLNQQNLLPGPDALGLVVEADAVPNSSVLLVLLLGAAFLLGIGEVVHDTSALTILPQVVTKERLSQANGWLSTIEHATNQFVGPPLAALLLSGAFALPFFIDAATFAMSAVALVTLSGTFTAANESHNFDDPTTNDGESNLQRFRRELSDGYHELRGNEHLWLLAIVTTIINFSGGMIFAIMVVFAQDVLGAGPAQFSLLTVGSAIGSVIGGLAATRLAKRVGIGTSLRTAVFAMSLSLLGLGFIRSWLPAAVILGVYALWVMVWVVQTVSFRQVVTAAELLGRVNGVYRFFSFGAIPLGAISGGLLTAFVETGQTREIALRTPFVLAGVIQLMAILAVAPRLANESMTNAVSPVATG